MRCARTPSVNTWKSSVSMRHTAHTTPAMAPTVGAYLAIMLLVRISMPAIMPLVASAGPLIVIMASSNLRTRCGRDTFCCTSVAILMPLFHWRLVVVARGLYPIHTRIQRLRFQCRRIGGESARLLLQWHATLMVALLFLTHPSRPEWRPHWGLLPFYHFYLFPFPRCQKLVFELERPFFL